MTAMVSEVPTYQRWMGAECLKSVKVHKETILEGDGEKYSYITYEQLLRTDPGKGEPPWLIMARRVKKKRRGGGGQIFEDEVVGRIFETHDGDEAQRVWDQRHRTHLYQGNPAALLGNLNDHIEESPATESDSARVQCFFRNLTGHLVEAIAQADCVVGCVAWLTHSKVRSALQGKRVALILHHERWLKREDFVGVGGLKFTDIDPSAPNKDIGVRTLAARSQGNAYARLHHKFFVFGRWEQKPVWDRVWTGSINPTNNAELSLENAVLVHDEIMAQAFLREFMGVLPLTSYQWGDKRS